MWCEYCLHFCQNSTSWTLGAHEILFCLLPFLSPMYCGFIYRCVTVSTWLAWKLYFGESAEAYMCNMGYLFKCSFMYLFVFRPFFACACIRRTLQRTTPSFPQISTPYPGRWPPLVVSTVSRQRRASWTTTVPTPHWAFTWMSLSLITHAPCCHSGKKRLPMSNSPLSLEEAGPHALMKGSLAETRRHVFLAY